MNFLDSRAVDTDKERTRTVSGSLFSSLGNSEKAGKAHSNPSLEDELPLVRRPTTPSTPDVHHTLITSPTLSYRLPPPREHVVILYRSRHLASGHLVVKLQIRNRRAIRLASLTFAELSGADTGPVRWCFARD